jgi:hypothetical protein
VSNPTAEALGGFGDDVNEPPTAELVGGSIFTARQEQLGLDKTGLVIVMGAWAGTARLS